MMQICPRENLSFDHDAESVIELRNITQNAVSFKIQTTSPNKFRIRPSCGVAKPNETIFIKILLKPEHEIAKDKFLIMYINIPSGMDLLSIRPMEIWKNKKVTSPGVYQHRLLCVPKAESIKTAESSMSSRHMHNVQDKATGPPTPRPSGNFDQEKIESQLENIERLQWVLLFFVALMLVIIWVTSPYALPIPDFIKQILSKFELLN